MNIEVQIVKDIPVQQISKFEDRVVYNIAVNTREFTKSSRTYPRLSGTLEREEVKAPIIGNNKQYGLQSGVDYAIYVYALDKANWTNKITEPHWYMNNFKRQQNTIVVNAVNAALKEV